MRWSLALLCPLASCTFDVAGLDLDGVGLALSDLGEPSDLPSGPDLSGCSAPVCLDTMTLGCTGGAPVSCPLGCSSSTPAHCKAIYPSGGAVAASDLAQATGLSATTLGSGKIDGETGTISGLRDPGEGIIAGIGFKVVGGVGVFTFAGLSMPNGMLALAGKNPIALVSIGELSIGGTIDSTPSCAGTTGGSGGAAGGPVKTKGLGPGGGGGGSGSHDNASGGAGGGFGGAGGPGAASTMGSAAPTGGVAYGDPTLATLVGGGGGGGGGGNKGGAGGGGGGALQLVATGTLSVSGGINMGGCGGGNGDDGGGGGGSGGALLIEAPQIMIAGSGILVANGGGGGGGDSGAQPGGNGLLSAQRALGGTAPQGGTGGLGGALGAPTGGSGSSHKNSGGGGGGGGRIRLNTTSATASVSPTAILSPGPGDAGPVYSVGMLDIH